MAEYIKEEAGKENTDIMDFDDWFLGYNLPRELWGIRDIGKVAEDAFLAGRNWRKNG